MRRLIKMNAGNRGCNSCHADLFDVLPGGQNSAGLHEVHKPAAYGRVYTYNDCITCHVHAGSGGAAEGGSGMYMATTIHGIHYANAEFTDSLNGNCFSCHEADVNTGALGMWDVLKYEKYIGLGTASYNTETWIGGRGYTTNTVTGGVVEANIALTNTSVDQNPSDAADLYGATNMDFPEINEDECTITISGVKNPKTYTLDELRAMEQTTVTWTQMCGTNGANGGWYVTNIEATGVLMSTIIEDCGGLLENTTAFGSLGYDGWNGPATPGVMTYPIETLDPNSLIALEYFGAPIDEFDGGPALFNVPGQVAFASCKWVKEVTFLQGEQPDAIPTIGVWGMSTEMAGWFSPSVDGQEFKVGEPIALEGYAFAFPDITGNTCRSVDISADYGDTWTSIEVPADFDVDQWTHWTAEWTPQVAGTYCLTVRCNSELDLGPFNDGHVLVKVVE
ncbi:MAG: molybdopterin-dependent oxidoreductase [Eggerthellaceae bacterium]|nr:molybdopterin-dependent oxidoreductase [Eggerthellaceae bacterium]